MKKCLFYLLIKMLNKTIKRTFIFQILNSQNVEIYMLGIIGLLELSNLL